MSEIFLYIYDALLKPSMVILTSELEIMRMGFEPLMEEQCKMILDWLLKKIEAEF